MPPGAIVALAIGLGIVFTMMFISFIAAARMQDGEE